MSNRAMGIMGYAVISCLPPLWPSIFEVHIQSEERDQCQTLNNLVSWWHY